MSQLNQFRVDNHDTDRALVILKKYAGKYQASYLIVKEFGKESGKPHLQGWVKHNATDNTFRTSFSRHYKELGTHEKCFTKVKDPDVYFSYIISNDFKPHIVSISDDSVITNYTQDKFDELKKLKPFVVPKKSLKRQDWYETVLESMEDTCVIDGVIQYHKLPVEYMKHVPKKLNGRIAYDNIIGIAVRLERKYPNNARVTNKILREVETLGDGIFDCAIKEYGE